MAATLAAAFLTAALLAAGASTASAVIVRLSNGHTLSYQPAPGATTINSVAPFDVIFTNLDYNGGPVMASNTNYAVYWDPAGGPVYPYDYEPGINRYFEDLAHDSGGHENVDSVSTQYNDAAGEFANYASHFGGALIDTDPYPANGCTRATICLTDGQLRTELSKYVSAHGLPSDLAHEYFLLTPPGVESCFEAAGNYCSGGTSHPAYCAYHSNIAVGTGEIVYANDPYVAGGICDDGNHPNGTTSDATLSGGLSHEHNESITDPEPNSAWTDFATGETSGYENGDKCRTFEESSEFGTPLGKAPDGAKYNQLVDGHFYWYQQEWSNQGHTCLQRFTFSGAEPTATFTTETSGEEAHFDASASTAPSGVAEYDWQFNDPAGVSAPVETAAPTISHKFPGAGIYTVALTVFAADGTSIGTARTVVIGEVIPTVTKVSPSNGPVAGGTTVTITGTNFTAATAVAFGSTAATSFTVNSATKITAVSPAEPAGIVDVRITGPAGTSAIALKDRFKFTPTVTSLSPNAGSKAGGTSVTVSGTGFGVGTTATIFKFGSTRATSVNCASATSCTVVAPAHGAGTVDVKAIVNKIGSAKNAPADQFTYN
ncbi:MAG TPA: IPT/TIG domain-containing protein [Solirubrobacteraceae bacterium]|nr:IPT/TIG domain-containing protein [Solirubrobacteraceae bacterium]